MCIRDRCRVKSIGRVIPSMAGCWCRPTMQPAGPGLQCWFRLVPPRPPRPPRPLHACVRRPRHRVRCRMPRLPEGHRRRRAAHRSTPMRLECLARLPWLPRPSPSLGGPAGRREPRHRPVKPLLQRLIRLQTQGVHALQGKSVPGREAGAIASGRRARSVMANEGKRRGSGKKRPARNERVVTRGLVEDGV